jgi:hypothetical protein
VKILGSGRRQKVTEGNGYTLCPLPCGLIEQKFHGMAIAVPEFDLIDNNTQGITV